MTKTIIVLAAVFLFWQSNSLAAGLNLTGGECDARSIDIRSYADERLGDDSLVFKTNKGNVTVPPSKVNNRCFSTTPAGYIKLNDCCTNKGTLVTGKKIESSNLSGCKERLRDYHRSCNSIDRGRSNSCVVAAHRYCRKKYWEIPAI